MRFSSLVLINQNKIFYKGKSYDVESVKKRIGIKNKINIVILGEEIYLKSIEYTQKKIIKSYIQKLIEKEFGLNEDYLFDYKINRKNKIIYILAIKGGKTILEISNNRNIKVLPFQMYIMKIAKEIKKKKDLDLLIKFMEDYYYVAYKNNIVTLSYVEKDARTMNIKIKNLEIEELFIDPTIKEEFKGLQNKFKIKVLEGNYKYALL